MNRMITKPMNDPVRARTVAGASALARWNAFDGFIRSNTQCVAIIFFSPAEADDFVNLIFLFS